MLRFIGILISTTAFLVQAAPSLNSYQGTYHCTQIMRVKPKMATHMNVKVKAIPVKGAKFKISWREPNRGKTSFTSGEFGNSIKSGDYEYRNSSPVEVVTFNLAPAGKYLTFSIDRPDDGVVASACRKE